MAQARVGEGHVERHYQHIGFVSLRGGGGLEPGRFEFRDHTRRTEQKEPFGLGMVRTDVVDGGQCGVYIRSRGTPMPIPSSLCR